MGSSHLVFSVQVLTNTMCHNVSASSPSMLKPTSHEITFAPVLLCDTAAYFFDTQDVGTNA